MFVVMSLFDKYQRLLNITGALVMLLVMSSGHTAPNPPDSHKLALASVHAAVATLDSGRTIFTKDAERPVPVASITKLMTAMVVLDSGASLDEWLTIEKREKQPPINSYSRLRPGAKLQRRNMLRIMLMSSENLAAYILAHSYKGGYDAFIEAMNAKSKALGMQHTQWVNPSGLSAHNRASAEDLVKMVSAAAGYKIIREFTQTDFYSAVFRNPRHSLPYGNTNPLVHRADWDIRLSKTGYLNVAGQCLAVVVGSEGQEYVMVFLNAFGRRSPLGDVGRVTQWLETGTGGKVARVARYYAQRKTRQFNQIDKLSKDAIILAAAKRPLAPKTHETHKTQPLQHLIRLSAPLREVYLPLH